MNTNMSKCNICGKEYIEFRGTVSTFTEMYKYLYEEKLSNCICQDCAIKPPKQLSGTVTFSFPAPVNCNECPLCHDLGGINHSILPPICVAKNKCVPDIGYKNGIAPFCPLQ